MTQIPPNHNPAVGYHVTALAPTGGNTHVAQTYRVTPIPATTGCPKHCSIVLFGFAIFFFSAGIAMIALDLYSVLPIFLFLMLVLISLGVGIRVMQARLAKRSNPARPVPMTAGCNQPTIVLYQQSGPTPGFYPQQNIPQGQVPYPQPQPYQQNVYPSQQQYPNQVPPYPVTPINQGQPPVDPQIPPCVNEAPPPAYDEAVKR